MINFLATLMPRDRQLREILTLLVSVTGVLCAAIAIVSAAVVLGQYLSGAVATLLVCCVVVAAAVVFLTAARRAEQAAEVARRLNEPR